MPKSDNDKKSVSRKDKSASKMSSRRFWVVVILIGVIVLAILLDKYWTVPILSILAGGVTAWVGVSTYFKEKNFKSDEGNK